MALREYYVKIRLRNRKLDFDSLEYVISKIMSLDMKDIKVVKEIEYTDGGYNVKEFEE